MASPRPVAIQTLRVAAPGSVGAFDVDVVRVVDEVGAELAMADEIDQQRTDLVAKGAHVRADVDRRELEPQSLVIRPGPLDPAGEARGGRHDLGQQAVVGLRGDDVRLEGVAEGAEPQGPNQGRAALFAVAGKDFLADPVHLHEVFGAASVVVRCADLDELIGVLTQLEGQLTATLQIDEGDYKTIAGLVISPLGHITKSPGEIVDLQVGDVLPLNHPASRPLEVVVDDVVLAHAAAGTHGSRIACQVVSVEENHP